MSINEDFFIAIFVILFVVFIFLIFNYMELKQNDHDNIDMMEIQTVTVEENRSPLGWFIGFPFKHFKRDVIPSRGLSPRPVPSYRLSQHRFRRPGRFGRMRQIKKIR